MGGKLGNFRAVAAAGADGVGVEVEDPVGAVEASIPERWKDKGQFCRLCAAGMKLGRKGNDGH